MYKPTVSRIGDRITCIRFPVLHDHPWVEYQGILAQLPDDAATREWLAGKQNIYLSAGWATVRRA